LHNSCINECCVCIINSVNLENENGFIPSDITETSIAENSLVCDVVVQELAQWAPERPKFN